MYGIGKKTYPRLEMLGIKTIGDFACSSAPEVKKLLGSFYYVLKDWCYGKGNDIVQVEPDDPKSISTSTTFLFDTDDYEDIKAMIYEKSSEVSARAIKEKKLGTTITLTVKDSNFITKNKSITIKEATNNVDVIFNTAIKLYEKYVKDIPLRLVGVGLSNLINTDKFYVQMSLFDYQRHKEECATKLLIDDLNNKMKKKVLIRASDLRGNDNENK
jgi:DNA polymerase-4